MTNATFNPTNKNFYKGDYGHHLASLSGLRCIHKSTITVPAGDTATKKSFDQAWIVFPNHDLWFGVRPCDVVLD